MHLSQQDSAPPLVASFNNSEHLANPFLHKYLASRASPPKWMHHISHEDDHELDQGGDTSHKRGPTSLPPSAWTAPRSERVCPSFLAWRSCCRSGSRPWRKRRATLKSVWTKERTG